jgi:hypothetical protein
MIEVIPKCITCNTDKHMEKFLADFIDDDKNKNWLSLWMCKKCNFITNTQWRGKNQKLKPNQKKGWGRSYGL